MYTKYEIEAGEYLFAGDCVVWVEGRAFRASIKYEFSEELGIASKNRKKGSIVVFDDDGMDITDTINRSMGP